MFKESFKAVSRNFQECLKIVSRKFQGYFKRFQGYFKDVERLRVFQGGFNDVLIKFQGRFKEVLTVSDCVILTSFDYLAKNVARRQIISRHWNYCQKLFVVINKSLYD